MKEASLSVVATLPQIKSVSQEVTLLKITFLVMVMTRLNDETGKDEQTKAKCREKCW